MPGCEQSVYRAFVRTKISWAQFINRMSMEYCVDRWLVLFFKYLVIFALIGLRVLNSNHEIT